MLKYSNAAHYAIGVLSVSMKTTGTAIREVIAATLQDLDSITLKAKLHGEVTAFKFWIAGNEVQVSRIDT